jgi:voltage-gated potassium channel
MTGVRPTTTTVRSGRTGDERPRRLRHAVLSAVSTFAVIALLIGVYVLGPFDRRLDLTALWQLTLWFLVIVAAVLWQVRAVLRSPHPWLRAVEGAVTGVALLLVPFAASYAHISATSPATFTQPMTRIDAFYFAVTVFATVGFGDIAPVSEPARLLVTVQMLADLVLIGTIVKVLVGAAQRRREALGPRAPRSPRGPAR